MEGNLEFLLLGPVEARRNGERLAVGGPRQRALLALLLLHPERPVPAARLADELNAMLVYRAALCLAANKLKPDQLADRYRYYQELVTSLGGTVLPPCS